MVQIREARIERRVTKEATRLGVESIKIYHKNGWPDRVFLFPGGTTLFIEFKKPGEVRGELQIFHGNQLVEMGFKVAVCDNYDSAMELIKAQLRIYYQKLCAKRQSRNPRGEFKKEILDRR